MMLLIRRRGLCQCPVATSRVPRSPWLKQQDCTVSQSGVWKSAIKVLADCFLLGGRRESLLRACLLGLQMAAWTCVSSHDLLSRHLCVQILPVYKDDSLWG